jgi:hypothetical protein
MWGALLHPSWASDRDGTRHSVETSFSQTRNGSSTQTYVHNWPDVRTQRRHNEYARHARAYLSQHHHFKVTSTLSTHDVGLRESSYYALNKLLEICHDIRNIILPEAHRLWRKD